tara:strand:- start:14203 stop:14739 length:537 start_codon:yes stop_codon:yes gene_type:complete
MNAPELSDYLKASEGITAINPKHQRLVTKLAQAHRRVDFHVDMASLAADQIDEENPKLSKIYEKAEKQHLREEEKWFDKAQDIQEELPQREIANTVKQLLANVNSQETETEEVTLRVANRNDQTGYDVASLLPSNYRVVQVNDDSVIVRGRDHAGWTAEGYVIPRLGSALLHATVEAS